MSGGIKKKIKVIMPSVTSFYIDYMDESELKHIICERLKIEPEFTNLIFVDKDEDLTPVGVDEFEGEEADKDQVMATREVIVDYIWARQMIALKDDQKKIRNAKALIVGAGALGSEIAKNLVWLGFGEITVVDYDEIELSNVSRGLFEKEDIGRNKAEVLAEKLGKNIPYANIKFIPKRIEEIEDESLKFQVILSALDNMPTRIWLASFCVRQKIPLIDGGIKEFQGRIQTFLPGGPCLACNIPLERYAEVMELANPCEGVEYGAIASFSTVASIVAGIQANEAMKIAAGLPSLKGVLLMDFLKNSYSVMPLERNKKCFVCGKEDTKEISV
jgi:molybdopterin/thiamine biosynthesis adenylyltransferase